MNSLNILSGRISPTQSASPSRANTYGNIISSATTGSRRNSRELRNEKSSDEDAAPVTGLSENANYEQKLLLEKGGPDEASEESDWPMIPKRLSSSLVDSIRWILSTLAAPGAYLIACLYDERGYFAPISQIGKLGTSRGASRRASTAQALGLSASDDNESLPVNRDMRGKMRRGFSSSSSGVSSESESDQDFSQSVGGRLAQATTSRNTRSKSFHSSNEPVPARRSIRIKLSEKNLRQRKQRKAQSTATESNGPKMVRSSDISPVTLKSPTSPASSLLMTKYPRAPAPPRPLIPRCQPSYTQSNGNRGRLTQKTLILDLDETLIHSMAKGGRMSTGHMVEVKLNTVIGVGDRAAPGLQHPILYWVNKRPHCDDFLRLVCKWYNLVVFTASVQEYADPVIDMLEQERKFFSGRYYRQHCTYRNGAFIKDLSSVEPDLSKVMILDNSPLSYMFHQDNAIPIEGWINDPTDNDLLHLMPLLESLQYVTDVRAFLALRGGEDGMHINN